MELPYLSYFNLTEEPFSTVPSPRYFFLTSIHATALEKTAYVVGGKKGLTAVFGDTGTGKSSLARLLHQKFLDSGFISSLITNPHYPTAYSFLRTISQELGIERTHKSFRGTLDLFKDFLYDQALTQHKTVVLIVDEAQTLTYPLIELLRRLINYETNSVKLLQLVLFAQDELRDTLARKRLHNFRSRIVLASALQPLSLDETRAMIKFRWHVASGGKPHPFTEDGVVALYHHASGMPRETNILADNALLLAFYARQAQIDGDLINQVAQSRQETIGRKEAA